MAVGFIKGIVVIIGYYDTAVFNPKGIGIILAHFMMVKLGRPPVEVLSVKKGDPFVLGCVFGVASGAYQKEHQPQNL